MIALFFSNHGDRDNFVSIKSITQIRLFPGGQQSIFIMSMFLININGSIMYKNVPFLSAQTSRKPGIILIGSRQCAFRETSV